MRPPMACMKRMSRVEHQALDTLLRIVWPDLARMASICASFNAPNLKPPNFRQRRSVSAGPQTYTSQTVLSYREPAALWG